MDREMKKYSLLKAEDRGRTTRQIVTPQVQGQKIRVPNATGIFPEFRVFVMGMMKYPGYIDTMKYIWNNIPLLHISFANNHFI